MKVFPEPRLLIFARQGTMEGAKGLVAAEKHVLFEIDDFTVIKGLILLIATYIMFILLNILSHLLPVVFYFSFRNAY